MKFLDDLMGALALIVFTCGMFGLLYFGGGAYIALTRWTLHLLF